MYMPSDSKDLDSRRPLRGGDAGKRCGRAIARWRLVPDPGSAHGLPEFTQRRASGCGSRLLVVIYLYAIVGDDHPGIDGTSGVGPHAGRVRMVSTGGVQAAISELDSTAATDDREFAFYRDVVDRLFRSGTVLPVRLGTVLADEADLRERLGSAGGECARWLETLAGKVEVEVTATYEDESLLPGAEPGKVDGGGLPATSVEGAEPSLLLQLGEAVSAELDRRRAEDARGFLDRIQEVAVAAAERPPEPEMALRASVLMERGRLAELDRVIDGLQRDTQGRVTWEVWGPLPPYAFAGLALEGSDTQSQMDKE